MLATSTYESMPGNYLLAVLMVLIAVCAFALLWGCMWCLCLVGTERRAFQAAKTRKRGSRPA